MSQPQTASCGSESFFAFVEISTNPTGVLSFSQHLTISEVRDVRPSPLLPANYYGVSLWRNDTSTTNLQPESRILMLRNKGQRSSCAAAVGVSNVDNIRPSWTTHWIPNLFEDQLIGLEHILRPALPEHDVFVDVAKDTTKGDAAGASLLGLNRVGLQS